MPRAINDDSAPSPPAAGQAEAEKHETNRPAVLAALRAKVARIEGGPGYEEATSFRAPLPPAIPLCPAINSHLPAGGLARAAVHDVLAADGGAGTAFLAIALARACADTKRAVFWIASDAESLWGPGLYQIGLSPASLVIVKAEKHADALWAAEEALRCPAVAGVAVELDRAPDMTASRRLQIAAEHGNQAIGLLLLPDNASAGAAVSASRSRWLVSSVPGTGNPDLGMGDPRWRLELLRAKGAPPSSWTVTWLAEAKQMIADGENASTADLRTLEAGAS